MSLDAPALRSIDPRDPEFSSPSSHGATVNIGMVGYEIGWSGNVRSLLFPSGGTYAQGMVIDGQKEGRHEGWYEEGQLVSVGQYFAGMPHGSFAFYDERGVLIADWQCRDGLKNGRSVHYGSDGSVIEEGVYLDGRRHGQWNFYLPSGRLDTLRSKVFGNAD